MTYNGWTNYATWNIPLWVDNDYILYHERCYWLEDLGRPVTPEDVREFVDLYLSGTTPDLGDWEGGRVEDVNWQEIADHWEIEREENND